MFNLSAISKYLFVRFVPDFFKTYCLYLQAAKAKIEYLCKYGRAFFSASSRSLMDWYPSSNDSQRLLSGCPFFASIEYNLPLLFAKYNLWLIALGLLEFFSNGYLFTSKKINPLLAARPSSTLNFHFCFPDTASIDIISFWELGV